MTKPTFQQKANKFLKLDYDEEDKIWLSNQYTLRTLIGILGIALPLLLYFVIFIDTSYGRPLNSMSHYYFTRASSVFVLVLGLMGIFLLVYKGNRPIDFYLSAIAGVGALCVVLFPTNNISSECPGTAEVYSVTVLRNSPFRVGFHYASAAVFLTCLAIMSIFLFTKSDQPIPALRNKGKKRRNRLYRTCGGVMFVAIAVMGAGALHIINDTFYDRNNLTFWMETLAVISFGIAWLVKGKKHKDPVKAA